MGYFSRFSSLQVLVLVATMIAFAAACGGGDDAETFSRTTKADPLTSPVPSAAKTTGRTTTLESKSTREAIPPTPENLNPVWAPWATCPWVLTSCARSVRRKNHQVRLIPANDKAMCADRRTAL